MKMNEANDFRVVSSSTAYRKSSSTGILAGGQSSSRQKFTLGEVTSANIVIDVNVGNGWTRIRLKEVPKFLVQAFNMITKYGIEIDGIFRKEGNSARLNRAEVQNIYRGNVDIPSDYTIIDVCTLVKRFLRDLKPPMLNSEEFRTRLLKKACQARISNCFVLTRDEMADMFYLNGKTDDREALLSEVHFSTLAYVMRQLNRIAMYHETHKMSTENLALVLVASVFGDRMHDPKRLNQGRRCSQDDILAKKKHDMNVHVSAVKLLITNANLIGVRKDPYITSNAMIRSSSAMPTMRCMSSGYETCSSEADLSSAPGTAIKNEETPAECVTSTQRRYSEAAHKVINDRKKSEPTTKKKRSSSFLPSLRDIKSRFSNIKRVKSPSPERAASGTSAEQMPQPAPSCSDAQDDTADRRQKKVTRVTSNTMSTGSTASGRQSRSQQSRRGNTNAVSRSSTNSSKAAKPSLARIFDDPNLNPAPAASSGPLRRLSQSEQNAEISRIGSYRASNEKMTATEFLMAEHKGGVNSGKTSLSARKTVVLGGIDRFAMISSNVPNARKSNRNRRHTAPVNNGLRRNRPNTVGAGLPRRRTTLLGHSSAEEKENQHNSDTEDSLNNLAADTEASEALLEQKAIEARLRRANRKQKIKNVSTESMMVLNGSMAIHESSTDLKLEKENGKMELLKEESPQKSFLKKSNIEDCASVTASETEGSTISTPSVSRTAIEDKKMKALLCDMATSPICFDSPRSNKAKFEHGHAWVGVKQTVNTTVLSPHLTRRSSRTRVSYSKANELQLDMPGKESPRLSPIMRHIAQTNNSSPSTIFSTSPVVSTSMPRNSISPKMHHVSPLVLKKNASVASIPPPVPPHSPPQLTPQTSKVSVDVPNALQQKRPPTPPSNPRLSNPLSPRLQIRTVTPDDRMAHNSPALFKLPQLPGMKKLAPSSPLARQPQSVAAMTTTRGNLRETKSIDNDDLRASTSSLKTGGQMSSSFHGASVSQDDLDDFGFGKYTDMVKSAVNPMAFSFDRQSFGSRPSVAVIRQNYSGLVRSRVNQYQEIEQQKARHNESAMSGRISSLSQTSLRSNETHNSDRSSDVSEKLGSRVDSGRNAISSDSAESAATPTTNGSSRFSFDSMQNRF